MSHSVTKLLLLYAQQFEDQQAPHNMTIALREAADTIIRLTAERNKLRAYALKSFTVVEFCCGEGFLLSYPHYDCDDLIMEGVDLLRVESSDEARAALSGDKQ